MNREIWVATNELLYAFSGIGNRGFQDSFKLSRVGFYLPLGQHEAQESARTYSEGTL